MRSLNIRNVQSRLAPPATMIGVLLAVLVALWSLRGFTSYEIIESDASRHAMNGVFVFDCFRLGHYVDALNFVRYYFARLPALSMPYHPPLFPAFEALTFGVLGVSAASARISIALCVGASILLLYLFFQTTHRSNALASAAVLIFAFLPLSQLLGRDIMLEFPALACVAGSLYALARGLNQLDSRWLAASALLAGAGCWTKQTVFLALVPALAVILQGRIRTLLASRFLLWYAIFALPIAAYAVMLWSLHWTGVGAHWTRRGAFTQLLLNLKYYAMASPVSLGCLFLAVVVLLAVLFRPAVLSYPFVQRNAIAFAAVISVVAVAAVIPAYDQRYLFFAFAPLIVIALDAISQLLRFARLREPLIAVVLLTGAAVSIFANAAAPPVYQGPREAAQLAARLGARRVLYCGQSNGEFIFETRKLDPTLSVIVIRGDKLPWESYKPEQLLAFAQTYGVDVAIFESNATWQPWNGIHPPFALERRIPIRTNIAYLQGDIAVYRTGVSGTGVSRNLKIPIQSLGRDIELTIQ